MTEPIDLTDEHLLEKIAEALEIGREEAVTAVMRMPDRSGAGNRRIDKIETAQRLLREELPNRLYNRAAPGPAVRVFVMDALPNDLALFADLHADRLSKDKWSGPRSESQREWEILRTLWGAMAVALEHACKRLSTIYGKTTDTIPGDRLDAVVDELQTIECAIRSEGIR